MVIEIISLIVFLLIFAAAAIEPVLSHDQPQPPRVIHIQPRTTQDRTAA